MSRKSFPIAQSLVIHATSNTSKFLLDTTVKSYYYTNMIDFMYLKNRIIEVLK
jgi:hypothetical protein